jgi:putative methyltransferase (TIGR04325 family)
MRGLIRRLLPKAIGGRQGRGAIVFQGDYPSWEAARQASSGYDAQLILERTREAILKVKRGEAVYERDAVLFDKVQYAFPVLAGLLRAALASEGRLCVLDFGGALGSSYFQCREFLRPVKRLEWLVVEQPAHVACGRRDIQTEALRFYETVESCLARHAPNVLLLSSVLPYLPQPYAMLDQLLQTGIAHVIIDRTPFLRRAGERLTVQTVPASIYPASYPAWFFSEAKLLQAVTSRGYRLMAEFPVLIRLAPEDEPADWKGFIFEKASS